MNMNDYPNRDALRKANDIYLDVMRSFIFRCLDLIPGETAESIIKTHIGSNIKYTFYSFPNSLAVAHECPSKIGISKKVISQATR